MALACQREDSVLVMPRSARVAGCNSRLAFSPPFARSLRWAISISICPGVFLLLLGYKPQCLSISRSLWIQLDANWRGAYYAGHALASAHPAGELHRASSCCTENNRTFGNVPERDKAPDGQANARAGAALYHRVPERHARMGARSTTACRRLRGTGRHYGNPNAPAVKREAEEDWTQWSAAPKTRGGTR